MNILNPVRLALATFFLTLGTIVSFAQCKNIDAEAKVVKKTTDSSDKQSIILEIKGYRSNAFQVSLFAPDKNNILNADQIEFNNLATGKYVIVIVGKREDDHYCPKSLNVTIN